jgi:class 3 adenylate cyclase
VNWRANGFPHPLALRIGLHVGPVQRVLDPITRRRNFTGSHVNRAARIEPITPPGAVYASEAFAALAAIHDTPGFVCEYAGRTALAKAAGTYPLYHVRRST